MNPLKAIKVKQLTGSISRYCGYYILTLDYINGAKKHTVEYVLTNNLCRRLAIDYYNLKPGICLRMPKAMITTGAQDLLIEIVEIR